MKFIDLFNTEIPNVGEYPGSKYVKEALIDKVQDNINDAPALQNIVKNSGFKRVYISYPYGTGQVPRLKADVGNDVITLDYFNIKATKTKTTSNWYGKTAYYKIKSVELEGDLLNLEFEDYLKKKFTEYSIEHQAKVANNNNFISANKTLVDKLEEALREFNNFNYSEKNIILEELKNRNLNTSIKMYC